MPEDVPMEVDENYATIPDFSNMRGQDPITPHALATVSAERDSMTDDEHIRLDKLLLYDYEDRRSSGLDPKWYALLRDITVEDSRLVTHKMDDAIALFNKNPRFEELLKEAWKKGSFKQIRQQGLNIPACFVNGQLSERSTSLATNATQPQAS